MKTREQLVEGICKAIDNAGMIADPSAVETAEHAELCFDAQIQNRINSVADRLGNDGINMIAAHCRAKGIEYAAIQDRHRADIVDIKNRMASCDGVNEIPLYPADVHVVSENPTRFGMTLMTPEGPLTMDGFTADNAAALIGKIADIMDDYRDGPVNGITCPACGSRWQVFEDEPVVHCVRCNTNWVLFTRRVLGCRGVFDPVSMNIGAGHMMRNDYLKDSGRPLSNPETVSALIRAVDSVPGEKVVTLVSVGGKYGGWHMTFRTVHGKLDNMTHFKECVDTAMMQCGISGDGQSARDHGGSMFLYIRNPVSEDADIDELAMSAGTNMQPLCRLYGIGIKGGLITPLSAKILRDGYDDADAGADQYMDMEKLCPWLSSGYGEQAVQASKQEIIN